MNGHPCVLSIDVEDWFHILDLRSSPPLSEWERLPSRVEKNFNRLLELASENNVKCTCFFLGWIAKRYPHLVKAAARMGHEIASHGWAHRLAFELTPEEFHDDAKFAKDILEQTAGVEVLGFRAPGFSVSGDNDWVFDELIRAGYLYDASVFPAKRAHGGWQTGEYAPYWIRRENGSIVEFPMTISKLWGIPLCLYGGGYLRLFPVSLIRRMARRVLRDRPVIFYIHPREIDPEQPRLPMSAARRFKTYVNLDTTDRKLREVASEFEFVTFEDLLQGMTPASVRAESTSRIVLA